MSYQNWKEEYKRKTVSMEEAVKSVRSGDFVAIALGVGACSTDVYNALFDHCQGLERVRIVDTVQLRAAKLYHPQLMAPIMDKIEYVPAFGMAPIRKIHQATIPDFFPAMTSDGGDKVAQRADVFMVMTTPPNKQGYVNLGLTNFYSLQTVKDGKASGRLRVAIAEVNENMPVVFGNNWLHVSEFDHFIEHNTTIPAFGRGAPKEMEIKIGQYILELINDGDTIQMGLGGIPEFVVQGLEGKRDLGVVTELIPIGLNQLVEKGIVTNARKPLHPGVSLATFCIGDNDLYEFVRENPSVEMHPGCYTNDPAFISQHPNLVAINMALMIDFSGQIASEGMGHRQISGSGGQLDFMIGAFWSKGGKGVSVLSAARTMPDGSLSSSIVPDLPAGTPITVPRTFAQYVVTEYGIANLKYKTRRERAEELIAISHPDLRGELRSSLKRVFYPRPT
ncbi:MAG: acetyl-CoA hydrolase/transferase family protein [Firmicutes bacterium]|nr:acetyl-CoA hydrolase/transferase family protein [Bacillota bacterium]